jgi:acetyl-CoA C-acetyltransferase
VAHDPRSPVVIGVGQVLQRTDDLAMAAHPTAMMADAVRLASSDAGLTAPPDVDSIRIVAQLSWRYGNAPLLLADALGLQPRDLAYTTHGGNTPQSLINTTALEIQRGDLDIAILAGGEATRTRKRARRMDVELSWPTAPEGSAPRSIGAELTMNHPGEAERGIVMPVQMYPMFESALRARAERPIEVHHRHISELWSRFSTVAATNPYAWNLTAYSPEHIGTVSPANRMIGLPYPKLMNSNNDVDMAAAVIVCSAERAAALGVPRDRWVFVHSGADCHEHQYVSERWTFTETPAIVEGGSAALHLADSSLDDIEIVDLYSCFPSAVQLGAASLRLDLNRQLTRTGGLPFAGGPWNNYVMHAIATVVTELRERPNELGFVWANGGYATKHAFGVYGAAPPPHGFRHAHPQEAVDALPKRRLAPPAEAEGAATIEAYTVMHARDGSPETAIVTTIVPGGARAWGMSTDAHVAAAMCDGEWVGRRVHLDHTGTVHLP